MNTMVQAMLSELDHELQTTRRVLERVPEARFDWTPHPKSMTMRALSSHLANLLSWTMPTVEASALDLNPPGGPVYESPSYETSAALLAAFDVNAAAARKSLSGCQDAALGEPWSLLSGGKTLLTMPRGVVLRSFILNHLVHHRGQLSVYLRQNDVPVPSIYGPSADERGM